MRGIFADHWDGNLMSAPKSLNFLSIYFLRSGPSFWAAQNDKGPTRYGSSRIVVAAFSCPSLNDANFIECLFENLSHAPVHQVGIRSGGEQRFVTVSAKQLNNVLIRQSAEDSRIGNLVAVEMEDRQHRAV